jgi:hypothetical protein
MTRRLDAGARGRAQPVRVEPERLRESAARLPSVPLSGGKSMTTPSIESHHATLVPDGRREMFLPTLFGPRLMIIAENTVYTFMERLCPRDYGGGFWNFYEFEGRPLFMAPASTSRFRIESDITGYQGDVSAEAGGIIATLFALSHLSFRHQSDDLGRGFERLRTYSDGHPEASAIFQAID